MPFVNMGTGKNKVFKNDEKTEYGIEKK